ncbi:hypothetical protein INS49_007724 [Diaporthe citri]|uniref:uncharacterized protein n=1 Tax=Diaporthe citri TaxID=83186 RepID=UPI001C819FA5|nr:uncharacterized protein INS49_007724 [Diaporthe citri]KAG6362632.1 hypothetical protein INS49_007724 [Diaporthe citri]
MSVTLLTATSGLQFAFDPAAAHFEWKENLAPWPQIDIDQSKACAPPDSQRPPVTISSVQSQSGPNGQLANIQLEAQHVVAAGLFFGRIWISPFQREGGSPQSVSSIITEQNIKPSSGVGDQRVASNCCHHITVECVSDEDLRSIIAKAAASIFRSAMDFMRRHSAVLGPRRQFHCPRSSGQNCEPEPEMCGRVTARARAWRWRRGSMTSTMFVPPLFSLSYLSRIDILFQIVFVQYHGVDGEFETDYVDVPARAQRVEDALTAALSSATRDVQAPMVLAPVTTNLGAGYVHCLVVVTHRQIPQSGQATVRSQVPHANNSSSDNPPCRGLRFRQV